MKWKKVSDDPNFENVLQSEDGKQLIIKAVATSDSVGFWRRRTDHEESYIVVNLDEKVSGKFGFNQ